MIKEGSHKDKMLKSHIEVINSSNKKHKSHFRRIACRTGYEFIDLMDWKWQDNNGNANGRNARAKYRKLLARKAKRQENNEVKKEIDDEIFSSDIEDDEFIFNN